MVAAQRVHFSDLASDFLDYILHNDACATILIVCSTRESFLEQLSAPLHPQQRTPSPEEDRDEQLGHDEDSDATPESDTTPESDPMPEPDHPLLRKTIGLLADSRKIKLAFCPTIEHLRAYLSVLRITKNQQSSATNHGRPVLAILDLVALHYVTSEFSAQGLSRTFAIAVEIAAREKMDLVLCECQDAIDSQNSERGERLWYLHVPLLSGSIRLGGEGSGWTGRSVPVKRVAQRWFHFEQKDDATTDVMDI